MRLEERHDAPAHGPAVVLARGGGACDHRRALVGWGRWWGTAGHVEEALVLLVCLIQHGGQAGNVLSVVTFAFLVEPGVLPFPLLHHVELFTKDVYDGVCRRL
jgi:hypothetical protein